MNLLSSLLVFLHKTISKNIISYRTVEAKSVFVVKVNRRDKKVFSNILTAALLNPREIDIRHIIALVSHPLGHLQPRIILRFAFSNELLIPLRRLGMPQAVEGHGARGSRVFDKLPVGVDEVL